MVTKLKLSPTGVCSVDKPNKAGYTAIMLAALSTVKEEEEDMTVVKKLFCQGNVNAKASQVSPNWEQLRTACAHGKRTFGFLPLASISYFQDCNGTFQQVT